MAAERAAWRAEVAPGSDSGRLVFLDDTRAKTGRTRTHGYAPRGRRLVAPAPHGHGHPPTVVGALTVGGSIPPLVVGGAINGALFRADVGQVLGPESRPGDVVAMANLGSHKVAGARDAIEGAGGRPLSLPPYSPDRTPIESASSKLERLPRKAAERTVEGLWGRIGRLLDEFRPDEGRNYFRHCGYPATRSRSAR